MWGGAGIRSRGQIRVPGRLTLDVGRARSRAPEAPAGLREGVGSPGVARCGAAGLRGRWARMRPPGRLSPRGRLGPGLRHGGKAFAPLGVPAHGQWRFLLGSVSARESSLVESRVLNY